VKTGPHQHKTDQELLEHFYADRNPEWIGMLLERYTLLLLGLCMKYMKNEHEARDCVQQVFLKVLTEVPKYRIDYFKSWLYMVGKNHCLMQLRAKQGKEWKVLNDSVLELPPDEQPEHMDERTYELLEESIEELNQEQKRCIILFYLKKKSYQQISEETGYAAQQVKSYIQNGKRNLKLLIEKKRKQKEAGK
jgi:RNA polymerase sigma factor (sigma-70 family)